MDGKIRSKKDHSKDIQKREAEPGRSSIARRVGLPLLVAGIVGTFCWLQYHKTDDQRSAPKQQTSEKLASGKMNEGQDLTRIKHLFSGAPMGYEAACNEIQRITGVPPGNHAFSIPDKFGLTRTPGFLFFDFTPIIFPIMIDGNVTVSKTMSLNFGTYNTNKENTNDGRIPALAAYILSKNNCRTEGEAISAITSWVMENLHMDFAHSAPMYGNTEGLGITHNHPDSIRVLVHGGVCSDFAHLAADLLDSVGIPARMISLSAVGLSKGSEFLKSPTDVVSRTGLSHALLEVILPSGSVFYDVTPTVDVSGTVMRKPKALSVRIENYVSDMFVRAFPGAKLTRVSCTGEIPNEMMSSFPISTGLLSRGNREEMSKAIFTDEWRKEYLAVIDRLGGFYILYHKDNNLQMFLDYKARNGY